MKYTNFVVPEKTFNFLCSFTFFMNIEIEKTDIVLEHEILFLYLNQPSKLFIKYSTKTSNQKKNLMVNK